MRGERDREILEEIEKEVQRILSEKRKKREKASIEPLRIRYFKSVDRDSLRRLRNEMGGAGAILVALNHPDLSGIMEEISELAEKARELNGDIYLIRWPVLLITLEGTRLEIREG